MSRYLKCEYCVGLGVSGYEYHTYLTISNAETLKLNSRSHYIEQGLRQSGDGVPRYRNKTHIIKGPCVTGLGQCSGRIRGKLLVWGQKSVAAGLIREEATSEG